MKQAAFAFGCALVAAGLAACSDGREAESKTPVAEAEVKTTLPEAAVSDQELQQAADQAAAQASTPAPGTVTAPAPAAAGTTSETGGSMAVNPPPAR